MRFQTIRRVCLTQQGRAWIAVGDTGLARESSGLTRLTQRGRAWIVVGDTGLEPMTSSV